MTFTGARPTVATDDRFGNSQQAIAFPNSKVNSKKNINSKRFQGWIESN
jgi:hypothetical protein